MSELLEVHRRLKDARSVDDVFGSLAGLDDTTRADRLHTTYLRMVKVIHPDRYIDENDKARAEAAFTLLSEWKHKAEGVGSAPSIPKVSRFESRKYNYTVCALRATGGTAGIIDALVVPRKGGMASQAILKVPHASEDNDLMEREADAYAAMYKKAKCLREGEDGENIAAYFLRRIPTFLESFRIREGKGVPEKVVNAFVLGADFEDGWFSLEAIRREYPDGVCPRVAIFIYNRVLEGLTFAHAAGIIHGAMTPNHILIHTQTHVGNIVDWTASVQTTETEEVPYLDTRYSAYHPAEILTRGVTPTPAADLYMAAWSMVYLLGGNPAEKEIPKNVPVQLRELINRSLQPDKRLRPKHARVVREMLARVAQDLYGPPKFVTLNMPHFEQ